MELDVKQSIEDYKQEYEQKGNKKVLVEYDTTAYFETVNRK